MMHHICLEKHITIFDGKPLPYGSLALLEDIEAVLPYLLHEIIPCIGKDEVRVCGDELAKRVLGRKIEDAIKREVLYEG